MLSTQDKANVTYDSKFDVLYYNLTNSSNAYGDEDDNGIVTFRDFDTDNITGYTIFNFAKNYKSQNKAYEFISQLFDINKVFSEYCQ